MKKIIVIVSLIVLASCKTSKTHCDAYGELEYDIHKAELESQKKYSSDSALK
jgi:hypothetical protein